MVTLEFYLKPKNRHYYDTNVKDLLFYNQFYIHS